MSLRSKIRRATAKAFRINRENLKTVRYLRFNFAGEVYDPVTHKITRTPDAQKDVRALLTSYTSQQVLAGMASPEDQRVTFQKADLPWVPNPHDLLQFNGSTWFIEKDKEETSETLIILKATKQ